VIVCTGPVSSGTRVLTDIVKALCPEDEVLHHSMPHWDKFWDEHDFPIGTRYVVITRRHDFTIESAYRQGHGNPAQIGWSHLDHRMTKADLSQWWDTAMHNLSGLPNAYWMSYEALIANTEQQCRNLADWLAVPDRVWVDASLPEVYDGNEKWL
jgi:hypothetical protein